MCAAHPALGLSPPKTGIHVEPTKAHVQPQVTNRELESHKKFFKKYVVAPKDKNVGDTWVMCPCLYERRLKELYDCTSQPNYAHRGDMSIDDFMKREQAFQRLFPHLVDTPNLKRHAPPYAYMLPKDKDPRAKSRPIVSYFNHPNKALLKVAAQAFMWVLKQVESKKLAKSFVQFDTCDFATSAPESIKKLCSEYPNEDLKAYLGDIKNMYTNIPHPALMEAIQWVVDLVRDLPDAKLGISVKKVQHGKSEARWACPSDLSPAMKKSWRVISIDEMVAIIQHDIENIFFTVGDRLQQQTLGIPMGSPCSPALAIALCMHAEHGFLSSHPNPDKFVGFRYIDDLLLFYKEPADQNAVHERVGKIYPPPLELEEETHNGVLRYLEHLVTFSPQGAFDVQHYHKNLHRLREGKQPLKNIPHHTSFVPHSYNFGRIVGALHRVTRSSIGTPNTFRGCINLLDEHIFSMQFPVKLILQAIYRMERSAPAYAPTWAALKAYYQPMQGW